MSTSSSSSESEGVETKEERTSSSSSSSSSSSFQEGPGAGPGAETEGTFSGSYFFEPSRPVPAAAPPRKLMPSSLGIKWRIRYTLHNHLAIFNFNASGGKWQLL
jgi:hypothetical protein